MKIAGEVDEVLDFKKPVIGGAVRGKNKTCYNNAK